MLDVLLARQPIFNRAMEVYGYELLYRKSMNNFYEGTDDSVSTAGLIKNAYLTMKLDVVSAGKRSFINFSEKLLIDEVPLLLPKEQVVIEILERVRPTSEVIRAVRELKKQGYLIALDDFVFGSEYMQLANLADIVKIEFNVVDEFVQQYLMNTYRSSIMFLAEKIETREDYEKAVAMGYHLFQGYFFSKPMMVIGREELKFNHTLLKMVNEMETEHFDFQKGAMIIEKDVGLSYQLLKLANSIGYGAQHEIYSIKQALARLGLKEIKKWIYVLMLQEVQSKETRELVNSSLIRAKFMELIAKASGFNNRHLELFMLGLFSSLDIIMNKPMEECLADILIAQEVQAALLGEDNDLRKVLECVLKFEKGNWEQLSNSYVVLPLTEMMPLFVKSIQWVSEIN